MSVRVVVDRALGRRVPAATVQRITRVARRAAARLGLARGGAVLGIRIVDDAAMIELHRRHLGTAEPTDVLSFPALELPFAADDGERPAAGDIAIDWDQLVRQSAGWGALAWTREAEQLVVHGIAHLAGHDHDTRARARRMARAELRAARTAGVAAQERPYAKGRA
ncbi:MAG TPA: rRNA maturation RNase YbeY [Nannocystaceae bacterium]|nr:rRNA maturation RNase YbeY [Nannocystaceae bacterium]